VDQAYILHSGRWDARISYVGSTRHRDRLALFTTAQDLDSLAAQMGRTDDRRPASKFHEDIDAALVKGMAGLKVHDGLPGKIAGQKRRIADLKERDGGSIFGQEPSRLAAEGSEERVKRLKIQHPALPDAGAATGQSTGAASRLSGAHPTVKGRPEEKSVASDTAAVMVLAVIGQMPGIAARRLARSGGAISRSSLRSFRFHGQERASGRSVGVVHWACHLGQKPVHSIRLDNLRFRRTERSVRKSKAPQSLVGLLRRRRRQQARANLLSDHRL
jgi:hypothetical protein